MNEGVTNGQESMSVQKRFDEILHAVDMAEKTRDHLWFCAVKALVKQLIEVEGLKGRMVLEMAEVNDG